MIHVKKIGLGLLSSLILALGLMQAYPQKAAAAIATYNYKDVSFSAIVGSLNPNRNVPVEFKRVNQGTYQVEQGGCSYRIDTKNGQDGDTNATWRPLCGGDSVDITITAPQTYVGKWVDHSTIVVNGVTYRDSEIDDVLDFPIVGAGGGCQADSKIFGFSHSGGDSANATSTATIRIKTIIGNGNNNCLSADYVITFTDPANYDYYFVWRDASTIATSDLTSASFTSATANPTVFFATEGSRIDTNCQSQITASAGAASGTLLLRNNQLDAGWPSSFKPAKHAENGCDVGTGVAVKILDPIGADGKLGSAGAAGSAGGLGTSGGGVSCESNDDVHLGWIICPILRGIDHILLGIDTETQHILRIDVGNLDSSNIKDAWGAVRNISSILLVLFALVMVVSTAIGIGVFDAYTIRKVLPRLVIAVIAMQLSWGLMRLAISAVNDIGDGIQGFMLSPFPDINRNFGLAAIFSDASTSIQGSGTFEALAAGAGIAAAVPLGLVGLASLAFTTALGVLIGFAVLLLRNIVILMAIIFAPLAIIFYILPGTQKAGKLWWDAFSKGLLMYPIIMAMFAAGKIFALVTAQNSASSNGGLGVVSVAFALAAYVVPFFLIPATFRFAGSTIASLGGMVNDRSKGVFDRARKSRGERAKTRKDLMHAGKLWNPNALGSGKGAKLMSGLNKASMYGSQPISNTSYALGKRGVPLFKRYAGNIGYQLGHEGEEQTKKLFEEMNGVGANDKLYRAVGGMYNGLNAATQKRLIEDRLAESYDTGKKDRDGNAIMGVRATRALSSLSDFNKMQEALSLGGATEQIAANVLGANAGGLKARLASLNSDPDKMRASIQGAGMMGLAAHGFANGDDLSEAANMLAHHEGSAGAQAIVTHAQLLGARSRPDLKPGYGILYDPEANHGHGAFVNGLAPIAEGGTVGGRDLDIITTFGQSDMAGAKGDSLRDLQNSYDFVLGHDREKNDADQILARSYNDLGTDKVKQAEWKKTHSKEDWREVQATNMYRATKDQVFGWAGRYSQASADIKGVALEMIGRQDPSLKTEFETRETAGLYDPRLVGGGGPPPDPNAPGGPGGPGGPGMGGGGPG